MLHLTLALLAAVSAPAAADERTYTNPVLYADYSDPDVIRVGENYYLVASSFHLSPGIPVLHSRDLVHWRIVGHVLPTLPFAPDYAMPGPHTLTDKISKPIGGTRYGSGVWAPAIRHHGGRFYVYWATPDDGIFMASADKAEGPWTAPVTLVAGPGYEDPAPFWDDDGTAWLIHSKVGAGPLFLRRMSADGKRVLDDGKLLVRDPQRLPTLEGPKLYKRDGWYYIWAPIGGVGTGPQAVGRSRTIDGRYEWRDVLVPSKAVEGPHQGGYVETSSGEGWFMHFDQEGAFGRIVYLEPVTWRDGWPVVGAARRGATAGAPVTTHAAPATGVWTPEVQLQASDEFDAPELGLQWSWNHNPDNSAWSLARRPGFLRLEAPFADHLVTSRNTLTQILQGPRMTGTARIETGGMADGQRAGLALFGVRPSWIGAVRDRGRVRVTIASEGEEVAGPEIFDGRVDLRFEVTPDQKVRYSYSFDGVTFTPLGDSFPLAPFSWWKGARPALFSFSRGTRHGHVDVDWFRVQVPGGAE